jgi:hypothetical protein
VLEESIGKDQKLEAMDAAFKTNDGQKYMRFLLRIEILLRPRPIKQPGNKEEGSQSRKMRAQ